MLGVILPVLMVATGLYVDSIKARKKRDKAYHQLQQDKQRYEQKIQQCQYHQDLYLRYQEHIQQHHAAVQIANQMYEVYLADKASLHQVQRQMYKINLAIKKLKRQCLQATFTERHNILANLAQAREIYTKLDYEKVIYTKVVEQRLTEVRALNQKTKEHKEYIRLNTGRFGKNWYLRLEQRQKSYKK